MARPHVDEYFMAMAAVVASRATCARRAVGCVLVNIYGEVLSTGYNGRQRGAPHCNESTPCSGAGMASGTGLDACEALHAEWNALLQCNDHHAIAKCYVTTEPCVTCTKMFLNTDCMEFHYINPYPASGRTLWLDAGRKARQHEVRVEAWLGRVVLASGLIPQP